MNDTKALELQVKLLKTEKTLRQKIDEADRMILYYLVTRACNVQESSTEPIDETDSVTVSKKYLTSVQELLELVISEENRGNIDSTTKRYQAEKNLAKEILKTL